MHFISSDCRVINQRDCPDFQLAANNFVRTNRQQAAFADIGIARILANNRPSNLLIRVLLAAYGDFRAHLQGFAQLNGGSTVSSGNRYLQFVPRRLIQQENSVVGRFRTRIVTKEAVVALGGTPVAQAGKLATTFMP